jgi:signal transduction histidine kinase
MTARRFSPPIEASRPHSRRSLLLAGLVFAGLLVGNLFIVGHLVFRDMGERTRKEVISGAQHRALEIARRLAEEGQINLFRVHARRTVISSYLDQVLTGERFVTRISVFDAAGRLVRIWTLSGGRAFPSAPGFHVPSAGDAFTDGEVPAPAPSWTVSTNERDRYLAVPIPSSRAGGEDGAETGGQGAVAVAIDEEQLRSEIDALRRSLIMKIVAGAAVSMLLLLVAFVYVVRLIAKTRRLEAEAQLADRLAYVGTLASGLAHEIRNPLNAMNMNLQMLEEEMGQTAAPAEPETQALLVSTKGEIRRLESLVNDFLAYARPAQPRFAPGDINRTIDETVRFLTAELHQKEIAIATTLDGTLPLVEMDEGQIRQALLNILINAKDVLGAGGRIEVSTGPGPGGEVVVRVRDNGPGIPPDLRQKIFEVFFSTRGGGTGLGLPIAQRILESHGGWIELESEAGRGTTFSLRLPRVHKQEGRTAPIAAPLEGGVRG